MSNEKKAKHIVDHTYTYCDFIIDVKKKYAADFKWMIVPFESFGANLLFTHKAKGPKHVIEAYLAEEVQRPAIKYSERILEWIDEVHKIGHISFTPQSLIKDNKPVKYYKLQNYEVGLLDTFECFDEKYQHKGLGTYLLNNLMEGMMAKDNTNIIAGQLSPTRGLDYIKMKEVYGHLGFAIKNSNTLSKTTDFILAEEGMDLQKNNSPEYNQQILANLTPEISDFLNINSPEQKDITVLGLDSYYESKLPKNEPVPEA